MFITIDKCFHWHLPENILLAMNSGECRHSWLLKMLKVTDSQWPALCFIRTRIQPILWLKIMGDWQKNLRMENGQKNCKMLSSRHDEAVTILCLWGMKLPFLGFHRLVFLPVNHKQERSS